MKPMIKELRRGVWNPLGPVNGPYGPCGVLRVLEDFCGGLEEVLVLVFLKNQKNQKVSLQNPLRGLPTAPLCSSYLLFLLVLMI